LKRNIKESFTSWSASEGNIHVKSALSETLSKEKTRSYDLYVAVPENGAGNGKRM